MATLLLQVAGGFLGGIFGPVGAIIGTAAGALAGNVIDNQIIASTRRYEGPRLSAMQPFTAEEGKPVPRIYGTMRVSGTLIWGTRFEEQRRTERSGSKGGGGKGPKVTSYSYYGNFAFALCQGEIAGIRRIWADGREIDQTAVELRVYAGGEDQSPDPLIDARQGDGNTPAYRGTAYVVFERFPLDDYGNRVPQFQFEVIRPVGALEPQVKAVCVIPGSTEFGLAPYAVRNAVQLGETRFANRHTTTADSDWTASLDELQALCPNLEHVALVVTWFGDDLDASRCRIRPLFSTPPSAPWSACGIAAGTAGLVSTVDGRPAFGGTPDDRSVIAAINDLKNRGLKVTLYPFVLMDIPAGNELDDPYGGSAQGAYPWRGRLTVNPAPGRPGSPDRSDAVSAIAGTFLGAADPAHFHVSGEAPVYTGSPTETGYRRFVLHCANLCRAAGGVDAFLIGSELRGLTTLRDGTDAFPFVAGLEALAADVRTMVGETTRITYGADWTEYFGHHPQDGSGDVFFHLDSLWAHPAIDAVGIDDYRPLMDWRDGDWDGANLDGALSPEDLGAMTTAIAGGEGYDWHYASASGRDWRVRTPITDATCGKPWVFRYKDIEAWWSNPHHNRIGGVEESEPTAWVPGLKPVWLTETGAPAVDKGANQPNVFPDPKSTESAIPFYSNGGRNDLAPLRYARAQIEAWTARADEPGSPVDPDRIYLWAWDARPYPVFPLDADAWGDAVNWSRGHWLNGRLGGAPVAELIETLLADFGVEDSDARACGGFVSGMAVTDMTDARSALRSLIETLAIRVRDDLGRFVFSNAAAPETAIITDAQMASVPEGTRRADDETPRVVSVVTLDPLLDYQAVTGRAEESTSRDAAHTVVALPVAAGQGFAEACARTMLETATDAGTSWRFSLPQQALALDIGDVVRLGQGTAEARLSVIRIADGDRRSVEARRILARAPHPDRSPVPARPVSQAFVAGPPRTHLIDLPLATAAASPKDRLVAAAWSKPWRPVSVAVSPASDGYEERALIANPARLGDVLASGGTVTPGRVNTGAWIRVLMRSGALSSVSRAALLNGANAAAVLTAGGAWELLQFGQATETATDEWLLTDLLRAQLGTEDAALSGLEPGAPFVLLDDAVVPAGLNAAEVALTLNFRFAPAGVPLSAETSHIVAASGGRRALLPLAPVHVRTAQMPGNDVSVSWIRRSRVDADSWDGMDIPLGEDTERYAIDVLDDAGSAVRSVQTASPAWTYGATDIMADFGDPLAGFDLAVRQIGTAGIAGIPALKSIPARS
ncbi:MAG: glycoside hydrolase/phage tail family protein [Brucellaceae bacterium]|nr:glycoside hydrolase/phage tail family protein [Brucellaceae bacterium]